MLEYGHIDRRLKLKTFHRLNHHLEKNREQPQKFEKKSPINPTRNSNKQTTLSAKTEITAEIVKISTSTNYKMCQHSLFHNVRLIFRSAIGTTIKSAEHSRVLLV